MNSEKAQWTGSELKTLISEAGGGTSIRSKQAHVPQCKIVIEDSRQAWVATGLQLDLDNGHFSRSQ